MSVDRRPFGLLGMLALVVLVELAIGGRRLDFTTIWADDWRRTAEAASREAKNREILCFGDSLIKMGILPRVIQARTGLRTYNLALNAGTMPSEYFLLRRALESGAKPKAIVVDFFALMLADQPQLSVRTYPDLATTGDCLDLAWTARDLSFGSSVMLGKLLPSYKCRFEVRASILGAFDGVRASPWPRDAVVWATWKANDGAQPMPVIPASIKPPPDPYTIATLSARDWTCDPINAAYFEKFLKLAASHKLPVFWLMPPLSPEIHAARRAIGSDAAYARLAREVQTQYPNVTVLDARGSGYDQAVHIDMIHLDYRGAEVLSDDLATVLNDHLRKGKTDRWVDLPALAGRVVNEEAKALARSKEEAARLK